MKLKHIIPLGCLLLLMSACSHLYAPALYHQDIAYQPKPTSFDAAKTATYISAGLNNYSSINYSDFLTSG
ncbi:MAG: hypothetical protein JWR54_1551, partial [Mucilaginibacter sp.]|nr:hypothetical protein [Mucilaginibacter sp.]